MTLRRGTGDGRGLPALAPPRASQPATLDYFMADYVGHLKHHLRQIRDRPAAQR